jgi:hypothetical protein
MYAPIERTPCSGPPGHIRGRTRRPGAVALDKLETGDRLPLCAQSAIKWCPDDDMPVVNAIRVLSSVDRKASVRNLVSRTTYRRNRPCASRRSRPHSRRWSSTMRHVAGCRSSRRAASSYPRQSPGISSYEARILLMTSSRFGPLPFCMPRAVVRRSGPPIRRCMRSLLLSPYTRPVFNDVCHGAASVGIRRSSAAKPARSSAKCNSRRPSRYFGLAFSITPAC